MNDELRQRLELLEQLFAHPGWKLFISDIEGFRSAVAAQWASLPDARALHFEQGRHAAFSQITSFEALTGTVAEAEAAALASAADEMGI